MIMGLILRYKYTRPEPSLTIKLPTLLSLSLLSATARFFKQRLIVDRIQFCARVWFDSVIPICFVLSIFERFLTLTQTFRQLRQLAAVEQQRDRGHDPIFKCRTFTS